MPELRWVVYGKSLGERNGYDLAAINALLGGSSLYKPINRNVWRGVNVHQRTIVTQFNSFNYGSRPFNECILKLTNGQAPCKICGPFAILSHTGQSNDSDAVYQDVTLADFSVAVDNFKFLGVCQSSQDMGFIGQPLDVSMFKPRVGSKVSYLNANTQESRPVASLSVQHDHPIYNQQVNSLSEAMSLPLLFHWSSTPKAQGNDSGSRNPLFDIAAIALVFTADTESPNWGLSAGTLAPVSGSLLIVRKDGKDLLGGTCFALLSFIASYMGNIGEELKNPSKIYDKLEGNADFQKKFLARDRFEEHFAKLKSEAAKNDPAWNSMVSPFDV